jgi:hypothetical protein
MPIPLRFVKEIHSRLAVRYGSAWRNKWAEVPQEALEADWADQLDGMAPEGIRKALASLPAEFPPTAPAFRALGSIREESRPIPALPAPDPAGLLRIARSIAPVLGRMAPQSEWMAKLERDFKAGTASAARRSHYAIAMMNGYYGNLQQAADVDFTPISAASLPPGMRAMAPAQPSKMYTSDTEE